MSRRIAVVCIIAGLLSIPTAAFAEDGPHHGGQPNTGGTIAPDDNGGGTPAPDDNGCHAEPADDTAHGQCPTPTPPAAQPAQPAPSDNGCHAEPGDLSQRPQCPMTFKVRSFNSAARKGVRQQSATDYAKTYVGTDIFSVKRTGRSTKRVHQYVVYAYVYQANNPDSGKTMSIYFVRVAKTGRQKYRVNAKLVGQVA